MKHLKRFNENFITDLFKKSDEDKIADEILKKLETSEVKSGFGRLDWLNRKREHYLSEMVFKNNTIQVADLNEIVEFNIYDIIGKTIKNNDG